METIAEYTGLKIPDWALSYIVNADDSGITPEDKKLVDDYFQQFQDEAEKVGGHYIFGIETYSDDLDVAEEYLIDIIDFDLVYEKEEVDIVADCKKALAKVMELKKRKDEWKEPYFTWNPEFGLACDVVDCTILIVK